MSSKEIKLWTDEALLSKISLGDEHAFRLFFDKYRSKVYSFAMKIIKSQEQAQDILQEVFLKIWQHKNLSEIQNVEAYLRILTRNHTLKVLRREMLKGRIDNELAKSYKEEHNEVEEAIFAKEFDNIYKTAIELLPPQQKLVYTLCRYEGLKYEEVAERLSISKLTVKTHMQHALRFLRNYIGVHNSNILLILLYILFK